MHRATENTQIIFGNILRTNADGISGALPPGHSMTLAPNPSPLQRRSSFSTALSGLVKTAAACLVAAASTLLAGPNISVEAPAGTPLAKSTILWGDNSSPIPPNLGNVATYSAGLNHTLALKADGTVAGWSAGNFFGEATVPFGLNEVVAISAGLNHSLALKADGTVALWGRNHDSQATVPPSLNDGFNKVAAISAGANHNLALLEDGWIVAWGSNSDGQGDYQSYADFPVAIAAGFYHNLALEDDGTVVAWGNNIYGQCNVPEGLTDVVAITAGARHSVALRADGTVVAWGDNEFGQITIPEGLSNVVKIEAGRHFTLALLTNGKVVAWGENDYGQATVPANVGGVTEMTAGYQHAIVMASPSTAIDDQIVGQSGPPKVFTIRNTGDVPLVISQLALSGLNSADFALDSSNITGAIAPQGTVTFSVTFTPSAVGPRAASVDITSNAPDYSIALSGAGLPEGGGGEQGEPNIELTNEAYTPFPTKVAVWGNSIYSGAIRPLGVTMPFGLDDVVAISGRWEHMLALRSNGTVVAWGSNSDGQTNVPETLTSVIAIAAGKGHSVALKADGTVVAWGRNANEQCNIPATLFDVVSIGAGDDYTVALQRDGTVVAWGYSGDGATNVPATLGVVKQIAAGSRHIVALKEDGTVANWGYGYWGQLMIPAGLSDIKAVGAGHSHTIAVKADGKVVTWGNNYYHQQDIPKGLTDVIALSGGDDHTEALTSNGEVFAWGEAKFGSLNIPTEVSGVFAIAAGKYTCAAVYRSTSVGETPVDVTTSKTFRIQNTGAGPLAIGPITISGTQASEFAVDTEDMTNPLPAGEETTFAVKFTPTLGGARKAMLRVGSNVAGKEQLSVGLTGEGIGTSNARLSALTSSATFAPFFSSTVTRYTAAVPFDTNSVTVTPSTASSDARMTVNGVPIVSDQTSAEIPLKVGQNAINIAVAASDGLNNRTYTLVVTRTGPPTTILPLVVTTDATDVEENTATLNGTVNAKGSQRTIYFDYGFSKTYDNTVVAAQATVDTNEITPVSVNLTGLRAHTEYHYRVRAEGDYGTAAGVDKTFTTPNTAPIAANDSLTIIQAVSPLNVLANDTDADGDKATFSVTAITSQLPATAGKLALAKGLITFTASKSFLEGKANNSSFSYRMTDGFGGTSTASVTLSYSSESIVLEPSTVNFDEAGGTEYVSVLSNAPFTISGAPTWLKATAASNTNVELIATPNTTKKSRTATFKVGNATLTVSQDAPDAVPVLGPMPTGDSEIDALVGAKFSLEVPTVGFPVKYTVTGVLPKGLTLNQTTGVISGVPTTAGKSKVTIAASNSIGAAAEKLTITFNVRGLPSGIVGTFHGMIERNSELNQILGSRIEVTTTPGGSYSGKIVTGTATTSLKGLLFTSIDNDQIAEIELPLPSLKATLKLVIEENAITGTLGGDSGNTAEVTAWRNSWAAEVDKAAIVAGTYSFPILAPEDEEETFPQGIGYGTLAVDAKTGSVKIGGKLADGSVLSGTTFVGPEGQVLIYVPLYTNRGSIFGKVSITPGADAPADNVVSGTVDWYKPAPIGKTADTLYAKGFGPISLEAAGGIRKAPAAGALVLDLPAGANNAQVEFIGDGFELSELLTVINPKATASANTVKVNNPAYATKFTKFDALTGLFEGEFTVENRKAKFYGQMGPTGEGELGIGYFIIRKVPGDGETTLTAPQISGQVVIRGAPPVGAP